MQTFTRRSAIVLGATTLTVSIAGCSGESGEGTDVPTTTEPTDTPTTTQVPFSLEHIRLCAEQPSGYREYTEQPDAIYEPDDVVWIYVEPSPIETEASDDGTAQYTFDATWTVTGPDGSELGTLSDTISRSVEAGADLSEEYLTLDVTYSQAFAPGGYQVDIEIRDTVADRTSTQTVEFTVESPIKQAEGTFSVPKIVFTDGEAAGYDDYTVKPNAEYGPSETVWYYYEIPGVHYEETDEALLLDLSINQTVTGPEGTVWSEADIPLANEFPPDTNLSTYHIIDQLSPAEEWLPGTYTITLEVTDGYAGETIEHSGTYTVVE